VKRIYFHSGAKVDKTAPFVFEIFDSFSVFHRWLTAVCSCKFAFLAINTNHLCQHISSDWKTTAKDLPVLGSQALAELLMDVVDYFSDVTITAWWYQMRWCNSVYTLLSSWAYAYRMAPLLSAHVDKVFHVYFVWIVINSRYNNYDRPTISIGGFKSSFFQAIRFCPSPI